MKLEWIPTALDECSCLDVKLLRMMPKNIRDVDRQRAIDEDRDVGKEFSLDQAMQDQHHLLVRSTANAGTITWPPRAIALLIERSNLFRRCSAP